MINVTIDRKPHEPIQIPSSGFHYVDQGNYLTLDIPPKGTEMTLYSDSATSCIIVVMVADKNSGTTASLAHLDSPNCITSYFNYIKEQKFDEIQVFAQGANPPGNRSSEENAKQLKYEIDALGRIVKRQELFLLEGDPRKYNRGDFGFQILKTGDATVTNQPYTLKLTDRDPTCGGQTVYCIMRRQEKPPIEIRNAGLPFTHEELVELSSIAIKYCKKPDDLTTAFVNIVNMENTEILKNWSTTPDDEASWFSDQLKQGACFAISMSPVVKLTEPFLRPKGERPFARLRRSLLRE